MSSDSTKTPPTAARQKKSWADLGPRLISAGVLLAVTIVTVALGGIWFAILLTLVFALIGREWETMVSLGKWQPRGIALVGLLALVPLGTSVGGALVASLICLVGLIVAATGKRELWVWRSVGLLFFTAVIIALVAIRGTALIGFAACFFLGATVWMTDTGAFFTGRIVGGAKLNPGISPAKTWSGALGGLLVGTLSGLLVWTIVTPSPWWIGVLLAALVSLSGQMGDLTESAVKRFFQIKDTSDLIPGHGGLMDRLDSLTFGAILVLAIGWAHLGLDQVPQGLLFW